MKRSGIIFALLILMAFLFLFASCGNTASEIIDQPGEPTVNDHADEEILDMAEILKDPGITDPNLSFVSERFGTVTVGSTIIFGECAQNNGPLDEEQPIEWTVLAIKDNKALVISKYALVCHIWDDGSTWEESNLRHRMETFYNNSFYTSSYPESPHYANIDRRLLVVKTLVPTVKNQNGDFDSGAPTEDKVFILSAEELERVLPTPESRRCAPTESARRSYPNQGNYLLNASFLRNPGDEERLPACVYNDDDSQYDDEDSTGFIDHRGTNCFCYVRPAMWLYLDK